jgi:hypothetical protein
MKPGDFEDIFVGRIMHLVQGAWLWMLELKGCTKDQ